ncbi:unnamed protein product [Paramecium octaurelia]|uniref:Uncharacterized protein n=1 Tax=Paramecium octaurelia TaxID=43137 RepID=A0A8S1WTV4_PAROT|nr:unnamed protein product [Paramecium octaurelia]
MTKNYWKETQAFCEQFNSELKGFMQFIKKEGKQFMRKHTLNLIVEMKVDLRQQYFENIRNQRYFFDRRKFCKMQFQQILI